MLGVITIDYKNPQLTIDFCNRELKKINVPYKCVVVVNSATEQEIEIICKETDGIRVDEFTQIKDSNLYILPSRINLGYAKGNNFGVEFLCKNFNINYLLFTNNDIEILSGNIIRSLLDVLESNSNIGAIGPRVIGLDGNEQSPHHRIISPYRQIGWKLFPFLRKKNKIKKEILRSIPNTGFCYWVSGAFFLMKAEDFIKIGGFDPNTFLYCEEPILAERLKTINKKMYFLNECNVLHYEGSSSTKKRPKGNWNKYLIESTCYYYQKYLHYSPIIIQLYKLIIRKK